MSPLSPLHVHRVPTTPGPPTCIHGAASPCFLGSPPGCVPIADPPRPLGPYGLIHGAPNASPWDTQSLPMGHPTHVHGTTKPCPRGTQPLPMGHPAHDHGGPNCRPWGVQPTGPTTNQHSWPAGPAGATPQTGAPQRRLPRPGWPEGRALAEVTHPSRLVGHSTGGEVLKHQLDTRVRNESGAGGGPVSAPRSHRPNGFPLKLSSGGARASTRLMNNERRSLGAGETDLALCHRRRAALWGGPIAPSADPALLQGVHLARVSFMVRAFGSAFILDLELNQ